MNTTTLVDWTITQLGALGSTVYDGMVPGTVPVMESGEVKPYLAVWSMPLREHEEQALAFCDPHTASTLTVTVVGHTTGTVRAWTLGVINALHRVTVPGGGEYRHTEPHVPIRYDDQVTPGRYYQPVTFSYQQP